MVMTSILPLCSIYITVVTILLTVYLNLAADSCLSFLSGQMNLEAHFKLNQIYSFLVIH